MFVYFVTFSSSMVSALLNSWAALSPVRTIFAFRLGRGVRDYALPFSVLTATSGTEINSIMLVRGLSAKERVLFCPFILLIEPA
jgi:hypothetical protein